MGASVAAAAAPERRNSKRARERAMQAKASANEPLPAPRPAGPAFAAANSARLCTTRGEVCALRVRSIQQARAPLARAAPLLSATRHFHRAAAPAPARASPRDPACLRYSVRRKSEHVKPLRRTFLRSQFSVLFAVCQHDVHMLVERQEGANQCPPVNHQASFS